MQCCSILVSFLIQQLHFNNTVYLQEYHYVRFSPLTLLQAYCEFTADRVTDEWTAPVGNDEDGGNARQSVL